MLGNVFLLQGIHRHPQRHRDADDQCTQLDIKRELVVDLFHGRTEQITQGANHGQLSCHEIKRAHAAVYARIFAPQGRPELQGAKQHAGTGHQVVQRKRDAVELRHGRVVQQLVAQPLAPICESGRGDQAQQGDAHTGVLGNLRRGVQRAPRLGGLDQCRAFGSDLSIARTHKIDDRRVNDDQSIQEHGQAERKCQCPQ